MASRRLNSRSASSIDFGGGGRDYLPWVGGRGWRGAREGGRDEGGQGTTRGAVNLYACLTVALDESLFRFVRAALELERERETERA